MRTFDQDPKVSWRQTEQRYLRWYTPSSHHLWWSWGVCCRRSFLQGLRGNTTFNIEVIDRTGQFLVSGSGLRKARNIPTRFFTISHDPGVADWEFSWSCPPNLILLDVWVSLRRRPTISLTILKTEVSIDNYFRDFGMKYTKTKFFFGFCYH